jgi:hypothetical protein
MGIKNKDTFHSQGINIPTPQGNFGIIAGNGIIITPAGDSATIATQAIPNAIVNGNGLAWQPPSFTNAKAPKNSIYFSTDNGKLVYQAASGSVFNLY